MKKIIVGIIVLLIAGGTIYGVLISREVKNYTDKQNPKRIKEQYELDADLYKAAQTGDAKEVSELLNKGAKIEYAEDSETKKNGVNGQKRLLKSGN